MNYRLYKIKIRSVGRYASAVLLGLTGSYSFALQDVGSIVSDEEVSDITQNIYSRDYTGAYGGGYDFPDNFSHPDFKMPEVIRSNQDGDLIHTLVVAFSNRTLNTFKDGQAFNKDLNLRSYDGGSTGPTFVVSPGDTLKIKLVNNLPVVEHGGHCDSEGDCDHNRPHNFNVTNLHTHGLHVDPSGSSDNVSLRIKPGESFDYTIHIPEDHVAGTFWYHAHVHGATTVQVGGGMHGAIIVRGDYDNLRRLKNKADKVMLLQHIAFDDDGRIEDNENYFVGKWYGEAAQHGWHISINGQVMPEMTMRPGAIERWRFIHAGVREPMNLRLINACENRPDVSMIQIAADGIPFRAKRLSSDGGTFLAPGYRSDVLVKARRRGVYYLVDASVPGADVLPQSYCDHARGDVPFVLDDAAQNILARVTVKGRYKYSRYPLNQHLGALNRPAPIDDDELSPIIEYAEFNIVPKEGVDPSNPEEFIGENFYFLINNRSFDPDYSRDLKLGTAQTWFLSSQFVDHPYHIHVNPFEVIKRNSDGDIIDRYWRDTVLVKQAVPPVLFEEEVIEIRTRYEDFTGSFVLHCHILDHEDRGMMENVRILP